MTTSNYSSDRPMSPPRGQMPAIGGHGGPSGHGEMQPMDDFVDYLKTYARERPGVTALWCLGVGFIIGWKLKPW
jgi:hypothetical protein